MIFTCNCAASYEFQTNSLTLPGSDLPGGHPDHTGPHWPFCASTAWEMSFIINFQSDFTPSRHRKSTVPAPGLCLSSSFSQPQTDAIPSLSVPPKSHSQALSVSLLKHLCHCCCISLAGVPTCLGEGPSQATRVQGAQWQCSCTWFWVHTRVLALGALVNLAPGLSVLDWTQP